MQVNHPEVFTSRCEVEFLEPTLIELEDSRPQYKPKGKRCVLA